MKTQVQPLFQFRNFKAQRGSLALEQVLFIGAIAAMAIGLGVFYRNIGNYFTNASFSAAPQNLGS